MANALDLIGSIGSIAGPALSTFSNAQGAQLSYDLQKQLMKDQAKINYNYYKKELKNRWLLTREGLTNANFNPMLAAIGNISGNSAWASPQSVSDLNFGSTTQSAVGNALDVRRVANETALNEATVDNTNADTVLKEQKSLSEEQNRIESRARIKLHDAERVLIDKRSSNFEREQAREDKRVAIALLDSNRRYEIAKQQNAIARTNSQTLKYNAETQRLKTEIDDYNAVTNRFKDNNGLRVNFGPFGFDYRNNSYNDGRNKNMRNYSYYKSPLGNYYGY